MRTKQIFICHHFLRNVVKDKDVDIKYIGSEEIPADIIMKNTSEEDFVKHMKWIIGEKSGRSCKLEEIMSRIP